MTKAQTISKLQKVIDRYMKVLGSHIFLDFHSMSDDVLYALAENDCKQLKQKMLQFASILKEEN